MKLFAERILPLFIALFLVLNLVYLVKLNQGLAELQRRYDELQPSIEEASTVIRQLGRVGGFFSSREGADREDPLERITRKLGRYLSPEEGEEDEPAPAAPAVDAGALFDAYITRIEEAGHLCYWDGRPFRPVNMGAQLRAKFPRERARTDDIPVLERRMFHTYDEAAQTYGPAYEIEIDGRRRNLYTWLTGKPSP